MLVRYVISNDNAAMTMTMDQAYYHLLSLVTGEPYDTNSGYSMIRLYGRTKRQWA